MKTSFFKNKFMAMLVAGSICVGGFTSCDDDDDATLMDNYTISGNAAGSQMVPAVTGTGTGTITGTYNPNNRVLTYNTTWSGLTGAPTGGGFYNGATGVSGTAVGTPWTFDATATGTGSRTGTMTLTEAQATQLTSGNWYYGYGTTANGGGEIRGQITATR
ncbi:MAG: CHRD domain-containing protein [Sphingobacteriales bacterium]|nr:MAG: CHRD domain-containing protein [Sphingobacteriales bacterium]